MSYIIRSDDKNGVIVADYKTGYAVAQFYYQRPSLNAPPRYEATLMAQRFIRMMEDHQGLYGKYTIGKTNGEPINPAAQYFVLRIDTDPAARAAMLAYADAIDEPDFANEIREWVAKWENSYILCPVCKRPTKLNTDSASGDLCLKCWGELHGENP